MSGIPGITPPAEPAWGGHIFQAYVTVLDAGIDRDRIIAGLRERGIESTVGTYALHTEPLFRRTYGYTSGQLPASASLGRRSLALPLFPTMTGSEVDRVAGAVEAVLVTAPAISGRLVPSPPGSIPSPPGS